MEIPKTIGILNQSQDKINRQLYKMLLDAEAGDAAAIQALAAKIGDETTANTILKRLKDLETKTTGLETTVGDANGGLVKSVNVINTAIGDESIADSILGRIKRLEDAE